MVVDWLDKGHPDGRVDEYARLLGEHGRTCLQHVVKILASLCW